MAELSADQMRQVISRVTSEVLKEVEGAEKTFRVSDLYASVGDLAKAGGAAWKITYDTKREADFARPLGGLGGGATAWKITYDTKREADFAVPRDLIRGSEPE